MNINTDLYRYLPGIILFRLHLIYLWIIVLLHLINIKYIIITDLLIMH